MTQGSPAPHRSFRVLLWALALTGLALDQGSKFGVFAWLHGVEGHKVSLFQTAEGRGFHLHVEFDHAADGSWAPHVNHGALFGFLRQHKTGANVGFAVVSLLAAVAILYWSRQKATAADPWLCAALGLILAGTLGNFIDRLLFNGVRDFLHWDYLYDWPVFNVADCCLVCGAGLLLLQAFTHSALPTTQPGAAARRADGAPAAPACVGAGGAKG
jgi:lipoprotein signal peptidase